MYCSRPTSPGGGYRSALGRLVFKTKEMIQVVEAPDTVRNKVAFSAFGFLDGEVSLKGMPSTSFYYPKGKHSYHLPVLSSETKTLSMGCLRIQEMLIVLLCVSSLEHGQEH